MNGVVMNGLTHRPIARVLVDGQQDAVLTDGEGRFELKLPAGFAAIAVSRPGFAAERRSQHRVNVGANMPPLTFSLLPSATITGHVSLSSGDEAEGIRVMLYRRSYENGHDSWRVRDSARTDSEGTFRLGDLEAPGTYMLITGESMDAGPQGRDDLGLRFGYPSVIYPGVSDPAAAGLFSLSPGQQAVADFVLARQPYFPVTIGVANRTNEERTVPMQIFDASGRRLNYSTQWFPQEQVARVSLPNGRYYAESTQRGDTQSYGRVDFTVAGKAVSGLVMTMFPLQPIPVHIRREFTATPAGGISGGGYSIGSGSGDPGPGVSVALTSADTFDGHNAGGNFRRVDGSADSSLYEIVNMTPGRYWVNAVAYQGYVSSMRCGGIDLLREPLMIGEGNSTAPIDVTLRNDTGSISGVISGAASAAPSSNGADQALGEISAVSVYAVPVSSMPAQIQGATVANHSTQFMISNLAPGEYRVFALDETIDVATLSPEERQRYMARGATATVEASSTANVQLDVIPTSEVTAQ